MIPALEGLATASTLLSKASAMQNIADPSGVNRAQEIAYQQAKTSQELAQKKLELQKQTNAKNRQNLLKKQMAKQRAMFAATGIGNNDGSSKAVENGLIKDFKKDIEYNNLTGQIASQGIENSYLNNNPLDELTKAQNITNSLSDNIKILIS